MKSIAFLLLPFILISFSCNNHQKKITEPEYVLVIHGGAGTILKENFTHEKEQQYLTKLEEALIEGEKILRSGGTSLDAITSSIMVLENSPMFNAGKGSVFNEDGKIEMDASIMNGENGLAGAISGVSSIKNPILAARAVMEESKHVMISGNGAVEFARSVGLEIADSSYFYTDRRWESYQKAKSKRAEKHGTVGAVALDKYGNIAAGTSTGGMTYKMKGRIGDSPIIGAGTYADNSTCAISATGHGEFFIRNVVAYDISALMKYSGMSLNNAAQTVIMKKLKDIGGDGGIIGVDNKGNYTMTFNTRGMYRGVITSDGTKEMKIFTD
jgi:L-asparaginase / beta-aspartyl-peptidase